MRKTVKISKKNGGYVKKRTLLYPNCFFVQKIEQRRGDRYPRQESDQSLEETCTWNRKLDKQKIPWNIICNTFILFFLINNFYLEITWLTVFLHYCLSYVSSGEERRTQGERGGQKEGRKGKEKGGILPKTRFFRQVGQELNESIFFCVCLGRT